MDCPYCQNAEIIPRKSGTRMEIDEIVARVRGHLSDGYCITGGEPTIHKDLPSLLKALRNDGAVHINLNTQGSVPDVLKKSLPYLDSVWFDVKTIPSRYPEVTRTKMDPWPRVLRSIRLLIDSDVLFWPRTTYVGRWMNPDEILGIAHVLCDNGFSGDYFVQKFVKSAGTRKSETKYFTEPSPQELDSIKELLPASISLKLDWS